MMSKQSRALLWALQHKKGLQDIKPLVTQETAKTPDTFYNMKPLFWALSYGASADVLGLLLQQYPEAASETHPEEGWTPLHYAEKLDYSATKLLLEKCPGAAKAKDSSGCLPLHWAAEHNAPVEIVKLLSEANPEAAFMEDNLGRLPMKLAMDNQASDELLDFLTGLNPIGAASLPAPPAVDPLPIGLLFPAHGSHQVKMMSGVMSLPAVQEMRTVAKEVMGYDIFQVCLEGPEEKLQDPLCCHPAMFIAALAGMEKLKTINPDAVKRCQAMAGLDLGEYAALCASGVFSFRDGLALVKEHAEAIQDASNRQPQATLTVAGLELQRLRNIVGEVNKEHPGEVCAISGILFQKGFQVGGAKTSLEDCQTRCQTAKAMQSRLVKGPGAYHTRLMEPAKERLEAKLRELLPKMKRPRCKVIMNVTGRPVDWETEPAKIVELILMQLTQPVKWKDTMDCMIEDGIREFYECGPSKQLKLMMKRIDTGAFSKTMSMEI